jgi:excisionase family DNA binding protein
MENQFISTAQLAKLLNISRVAVFNKIKKGEIKAEKVGRAFVINKKDIPELTGGSLSEEIKKGIQDSVTRTVKEYGETLRLLGKE